MGAIVEVGVVFGGLCGSGVVGVLVLEFEDGINLNDFKRMKKEQREYVYARKEGVG